MPKSLLINTCYRCVWLLVKHDRKPHQETITESHESSCNHHKHNHHIILTIVYRWDSHVREDCFELLHNVLDNCDFCTRFALSITILHCLEPRFTSSILQGVTVGMKMNQNFPLQSR